MVAPSGVGVHLGSDAGGDGFRRCERVAPNAENAPPPAAKLSVDAMVAGPIASDLLPPIFTVSVRHPAVPTAAVPKTSVHKDGEARLGKNEVRLPWQWAVSAPTFDSMCAED